MNLSQSFEPTKIVRGQDLCKLTTESIDKELENEPGMENVVFVFSCESLLTLDDEGSWYIVMKHILSHGSCPSHLNPKGTRELRLNSMQYTMINGILFHINYDKLMLRCIEKGVYEVLKYLCDGIARGHSTRETTTHKILRVGYY